MSLLHPHRRRLLAAAYRNNPELADIIERNIAAMLELQRAEERKKTRQDRSADALTAFSGNMLFVYLHALWFGLWMVINLGWSPIQPFDPFPFGLLTMIVSLEAIFLSTFVLISQNRAGAVANKRADLDLQINLLAEHEITRLVILVDAIADHLGVEVGRNPALNELKKDVAPMQVLDEMRERQEWEKTNLSR
jgi:uncharacterized membrane protein